MGFNAAARDRHLVTSRWIRSLRENLDAQRPESSVGRRALQATRLGAKAVGFVDRVADRWFRYGWARYKRRAGKVVVFDRYVFDPRVRGAGSNIRAAVRGWLLSAGAPKPDLVLVLDAPVAVLHSRKDEQTPERLERLREAYLDLAHTRSDAQVVDASRDLATVVADVTQRIHGQRRIR